MRRFTTGCTLALTLALASQAHAEGTKQLSPTAADTSAIIVNSGNYGSFAAAGGPADSRLYVHLEDPANEQVFFGFSRGSSSNYRYDVAGTYVDYYYRLVRPDGTPATGWRPVDAATANLNAFTQVTAGPADLGDAAGYATGAGFSFVPGVGLPGGDYYVELSTANDGSAGATFYVPRFDITVATRDATPLALPGRVFSLNWAIGSPRTKDNANSPYGVFDRPFKGHFYVYSPEGFVSFVDFENAGFRPYLFNISFNSTGTVDFLDPLGNLRSVDGQRRTNPEFRIFLNAPAVDIYPSGTFGTMITNADYPRLYGCTADDKYYVEVAVTKAGQVEVLIDEDGGDGEFTPYTADRMLSLDVAPRPGESAPYVRQVPWDGRDGLGNLVATTADLSSRVTFSQVPYHLPVYDAEYMTGGFEVTMVRPAPPAGYAFTYQWDDRNILEDAPAGARKVELEGCATGCHTWDQRAYGDENTINTYWFARREATATLFNRADPACGCSAGGTLTIGGVVYDDADGSRTNNAAESGYAGVEARLWDDANADGVVDEQSESIVQTATTNLQGEFSFTVNTTGTPGTVAANTASAEADALYMTGFQNPYRADRFGFGSYDYTANGVTTNYPFTTSVFFTGVSLPAGATITSATLTLVGDAPEFAAPNDGGPGAYRIYAESGGNPAVTSATSVPTQRPRTATNALWEFAAAAVAGTTYTSPDLSEVFQELVNTPEYATGHNLHLIVQGTGGYNAFRQFGQANPPQLSIAYTVYNLPQTYVVTVDAGAAALAGKVATTDSARAVGLYLPSDYSCFNDFGFGVDRDGDGVVDGVDLDNDNDGIADADEDGGTGFSPTGDADGDGVLNFADDDDQTAGFPAWADLNGDGVHDRYDADGDGVPDVYDLDADNDGVTDLAEAGGTDANGDGLVDDPADADGDGLADAYDNNDTDGPLGNGLDATTPSTSALTDTDADGVTDGADADGDGIPNYVDLDSDNDGLTDATEHGVADADGDGRLDGPAAGTPPADADGDGLADAIDPLHDGPEADANAAPATAGTPTTLTDADGDGVAAAYDLDADGDGVADAVEAGATDADGDGRVDATADADGDGLADVYDLAHDGPRATAANAPTSGTSLAGGPDTDADGVPDRLDLDSDNDGIADLIEAGGADVDGDGRADGPTSGAPAPDADGDGLADAYDADAAGALVLTGADADGDGRPEGYPGNDLDGDGVLDFRDLDSDQDGIPDLVEAMGADADGDGRVDDPTDADGDGLADVVDGDDDATPAPGDGNGALVVTDASGAVVDTRAAQGLDLDGDGHANWRDRDSDDDGIADLTEAGIDPATADADADGRLDPGTHADLDGDGLADAYDADANDGPAAAPGSTHADGTPAVRTRPDADADGSATAEGFAAGTPNADTDDRPDFRDLDSDDDGVTDNVEQNGGAVTNDADGTGGLDGRVPTGDTGVDYLVNNTATPLDTDGDGVPDYRDVDADNDGLLDRYEAICTACAAQVAPTGTDANANGVDDGFEGLTAANATGGANVGATPQDMAGVDADAAPDYLDADADGDGVRDETEGFDDDGDGVALDDLLQRAADYETANGSPGDYDNAADGDGDGVPDWLDNLAGAGTDETQALPFLDPGSGYWVDANGDGLADLYDAGQGGTPSVMPDRDNAGDRDWRDAGTEAPLPVTVTSFRARAVACELLVEWGVGTEVGVRAYALEASADGRAFETVAEVAATGADAYATRLPASATATYLRLRTLDEDGGEALGTVVSAEVAPCGGGEAAVAIAPNPVSGGADLSVRSPAGGSVELADVTGRVVFRTRATPRATVAIPTAGLAAGLYALRVGTDVERVVIR